MNENFSLVSKWKKQIGWEKEDIEKKEEFTPKMAIEGQVYLHIIY